MPRTTRSLALLLALTPACAEDSSFVLRWNVGRTADDAEIPLRSVRQCSDLGLSTVRVTTQSADGTVEDQRDFPCFPEAFGSPTGTAPGPELSAGTYFVTIVGLTRRGIPRPDPSGGSDDDALARDRREVVVNSRGEGVLADGFRLIGIDECHDGIDNDRDGAIDQADTPCRLGQTAEDQDVSGALFTFDATLLGDNPRATCAGLGIDLFRITLDADTTREIPCTLLSQSFNADLPAGEHTWKVEALGPTGDVLTTALTGEPFVVPAKDFVLVPIAVDFTIDTFLADPAFARPQRFALEFEPYPDAPLARQCLPNAGALVLDEVRLTLQGAAADAPDTFTDVTTVTIPALADAPFPITAECLDFQAVRSTSDLEWSADGFASYRLLVEALPVDGDVACFSNAESPAVLAPGVDLALTIPRVRSDGACSDCPTGDECPSCVDGVCMP